MTISIDKKAKKSSKTGVRNAAQTKARILEAAFGVFSKKGFDGAATSEIVKSARINKRMLYHYFGDKEGLYRAVFVQQWSELKSWFDQAIRRRIEEGGGLPSDVRTILGEALDTCFDFMAAKPDFVRLMMWEGLEGGQISRAIWKEVRGPIYVQVEFLIKQAQEEGVLDHSVDPAQLIISFLGSIGFYFAYAPTLVEMIRKDPYSPSALKERKTALREMLESQFVQRR